MKKKHLTTYRRAAADSRPGAALMLTLVTLVLLTAIVTALSVRVARAKHRLAYMMDYQRARYGLDSALKYMFAVFPESKASLAGRKDAPDFSDLFWMSPQQYDQFIVSWASQLEDPKILNKYLKKGAQILREKSDPSTSSGIMDTMFDLFTGEPNRTTGYDPNDPSQMAEYLDPNQIVVPGPWGPTWPQVIEPVELEMCGCQVRITVEDENAKLPLSWAVMGSVSENRQATAAYQTFAEWMQIPDEQLDELFSQMEEIVEKKKYTLNPSPMLLTPASQSAAPQPAQSQQFSTSRRRRRPPVPVQAKDLPLYRPALANCADFAKLFHSSMLNTEPFAVLLPQKAFADESALKYMGVWGTQRVNINTAPRHVLEAVFTFGGNAVEIAEKIIIRRKEKPFSSIKELRDANYSDSDSIDRALNYIDIQSNVFTIKIISRSGSARATAVAAIVKENKQMEKLAVIYGR